MEYRLNTVEEALEDIRQGKMIIMVAVSYTHLDVYKRQSQ